MSRLFTPNHAKILTLAYTESSYFFNTNNMSTFEKAEQGEIDEALRRQAEPSHVDGDRLCRSLRPAAYILGAVLPEFGVPFGHEIPDNIVLGEN